MKQWLRVALMMVVAGGIAACGSRKEQLHVYTWADYIKPELIAQFEKEHNCTVVIDTYDSNEAMFAKLKAGAGGYDVIFPSSYMAKVMRDQGMLQDLDPAKLPNRSNLDPVHTAKAIDRDMKYSVPYTLTIVGMAYLDNKVADFSPSWSQFARTDLKGRMTMLNDMRETIGAALKSLGYSLNTTNDEELAKAQAVVVGWKKNLAKLENEAYKTGLASEEFSLVHGYSGDILQVQESNSNIVFAVPEEGCSIAYDDMVIPTGAPKVDLAHAFINFILDPKVAAENIGFTGYLCPNKACYALLDEETRQNPILFPSEAALAKCEIIVDLGALNAKYTKAWDAIKAAD